MGIFNNSSIMSHVSIKIRSKLEGGKWDRHKWVNDQMHRSAPSLHGSRQCTVNSRYLEVD